MARSLYKLPYIHRSLWAKSIKSRKNITYSEVLAEKVLPYETVLAQNLYF
jgi:hypothetical protein